MQGDKTTRHYEEALRLYRQAASLQGITQGELHDALYNAYVRASKQASIERDLISEARDCKSSCFQRIFTDIKYWDDAELEFSTRSPPNTTTSKMHRQPCWRASHCIDSVS